MTESDTEVTLKKIAAFYDRPAEALAVLTQAHEKKNSNLSETSISGFLRREKLVHDKRVQNKIPHRVTLLRLALDETPLAHQRGHSPGAPAYQAEQRYKG
jgi:hypothetical protein